MKKSFHLVCAILSLTSITFAEEINGGNDPYISPVTTDYRSGIYFGAQLGGAKLHYNSEARYLINNNSYDSGYNLAGRANIGYAFSQFIATELGYDYYGYPKFKQPPNTQNILQHGLDLMLKASLPLDYGFGFYIKGGLALIHRSALHGNEGAFANKPANNKVTPIGSIGINYWFAPHIALDAGYTKTMSISDLPTIDFFALGFIYKIRI